MSCGKVILTFKEAKAAIARNRYVRKHESMHREECRIYHCRECNGWHLTSKGTTRRIARAAKAVRQRRKQNKYNTILPASDEG